MEKFDEKEGRWITFRGRKIFIRSGESLGNAMVRSGKFKENGDLPKRGTIKQAKMELSMVDNDRKYQKYKSNLKKKEKLEHKDVKTVIKNDTQDESNMYKKYYINPERQAAKNRINEETPTHSGIRIKKYQDKYIVLKNGHNEGELDNKEEARKHANTLPMSRVEKNYNRYSENDKKELKYNEMRKAIKDYKAKKQSNNKIEIKNNNGELTGYTDNERIEYHHSGHTGLMGSVFSTDDSGLLRGHFFNIPKEYQGDKLKEYTLKEIERLKSDKKAYNERNKAGIPEKSKYKNVVSKKQNDNEYSLYKRAKERPESIDPMTENSTDWEALEKKYGKRYEKENKKYKPAKEMDLVEEEHTALIKELETIEKYKKRKGK